MRITLIRLLLAGGNGNGGTRDAQKIGEELDAGVVGSAFHRRRGQRKFKSIADFASDCVFLARGWILMGK